MHDNLVRAKDALEELGSAAAHRLGERRAERLVDDVSAGLVELARVNQAAIGELLAERDEARAENERLRFGLQQIAGYTVVTMAGAEVGVSDATKIARAALAAAQEPPADEARAVAETLREILREWLRVFPVHRPECNPLTTRGCTCGLERVLANTHAALAAAQEPPPATEGLPSDLARVLRDQSVVVSQDGAVFGLIGKWANAPSDTASGAAQEPPADATDCWGEDVRFDSSECEPPAKGDDRDDLGGSDV